MTPLVSSQEHSSKNDPKDEAKNDTARSAGRGGLAILAAKVFFIISGFAQQSLLPLVIGLDGYGAMSRVFAAVNMANNVVVTSSIQGVSRAISQSPEGRSQETLRRTFLTHLCIAAPVALLFFLFAPLYGRFQHAPHIVTPLRVVSLVLLAYGLYAPLVGALNGQRRFSVQAGLDITYAVLRTLGLLTLGWFFARQGQGPLGACLGFTLAALIIFPIALRITGVGKSGNAGPSVSQHLAFIAPVALGQVFLQLLMQSDISILGRFASELVLAQGLVADEAAKASDKIVGVYRACQLFAFLPFQLLISLTFILFPMLAKAKAEQDKEAIARYVATGMRLTLVLACVMVATVSALAPQLLRLVFSQEVSENGALALRILALGQGAFAVFYVETTVLTSLGHERISAFLTAGSVALITALTWTAASSATSTFSLLFNVASAVSIALTTSAVAGAILVRIKSASYAQTITVLRVLLALPITVLVGSRLPRLEALLPLPKIAIRLAAVPEAALMAALCLAILTITGELGRADLYMVKNVVLRRKPNSTAG